MILEEIIKSKKSNYKPIYTELKKIFNGNVGNDKVIKGNPISLPVYIKGKTFKIAYMLINGITIVISGGQEEEINKSILKILNSREFLVYLKEIRAQIKDGNIPDESEYTEAIITELQKVEAVRKMTNFS